MWADFDHLVGSDDLICRLLTAVDAGAWARRDEGNEDVTGAPGDAARGKQRNGLDAWMLAQNRSTDSRATMNVAIRKGPVPGGGILSSLRSTPH